MSFPGWRQASSDAEESDAGRVRDTELPGDAMRKRRGRVSVRRTLAWDFRVCLRLRGRVPPLGCPVSDGGDGLGSVRVLDSVVRQAPFSSVRARSRVGCLWTRVAGMCW